MTNIRMSPNHREVISAISDVTNKQEYLTSHNGALNINGSFSITGSSIPISGATTGVGVAILDSSGNQISSFGGGTQYVDGGVPPAHPTGNTIEWSDGSFWQTVSTAKPLPVTASFSPSGTQDVNMKQVAGTATSVNNGTVDAGTQRVTIASDSTGLIKLATGANTVGSIANTTFAATQATAANLNATVVGAGSAGAANSGVVTVQGIAAMTKLLVTPDSVALPANQSVNVSQINGITPLMGNGTTGTGSQRVTIASDNTAFSVNATLSAETTKVIGVVRNADGSGNLLTSTGNALDINLKTSSITLPVSLTSTTITGTVAVTQSTSPWVVAGGGSAGTAATGVVTVQGIASMTPVQVSQATGTNLHMVVDSGTITTVSTISAVTAVGTITPGTAATSLGKAEDAVHNSGDVGVFGLAIGNEAQTTLAADGDYIGHAVDIKGNTLAVGNLANDAVDAGNPVKVGGYAVTALPTAVANADRVNFIADTFGRQVFLGGTVRNLRASQRTVITSSTAETTVVTAGAAGIFNDLVAVICSNTSATVTLVDFRDDTAGTIIFTLEVPPNGTAGFAIPSESWPQTATAKNWTAQCGTSVASLIVNVLYEKNK